MGCSHNCESCSSNCGAPKSLQQISTQPAVHLSPRPADDIPRILRSLDRTQAGITMPPHGLILEAVFYTH